MSEPAMEEATEKKPEELLKELVKEHPELQQVINGIVTKEKKTAVARALDNLKKSEADATGQLSALQEQNERLQEQLDALTTRATMFENSSKAFELKYNASLKARERDRVSLKINEELAKREDLAPKTKQMLAELLVNREYSAKIDSKTGNVLDLKFGDKNLDEILEAEITDDIRLSKALSGTGATSSAITTPRGVMNQEAALARLDELTRSGQIKDIPKEEYSALQRAAGGKPT